MKRIPKSLRVMYDGASSGIWVVIPEGDNRFTRHYEISHDELGLPDELAARFDQWIARGMNDSDRPNDPKDPLFISDGKRLAFDLKRFIGTSSTILYASQSDILKDEEILLDLEEGAD